MMKKLNVKIAFGFIAIVVSFVSCGSFSKKNTVCENNLLEHFTQGVDLSYVNQVEDFGATFKEHDDDVDVFGLFKDKGATMVRLRLWHNPDWVYDIYSDTSKLYSGFEDVRKSIKRAKSKGLQVNLDFHYSDTWADPGHQSVPKAWRNIQTLEVLADSVYHYTYEVLSRLYREDLLPEMVQIGNESNCGFMHSDTINGFPDLSVCNGNWESFGTVVNAGIKAVRDIDELSNQHTIIALHIADPVNLKEWFTSIMTLGKVTDFDVAGFSYYPHWHTDISFNSLPQLVKEMKCEINKDVMILETAYPYTLVDNDTHTNIFNQGSAIKGYPISIEGQRKFMIDLTRNMKDAGACGVMYWEPAWITSDMHDLWGKGSAWDNATLFSKDGNITKASEYLSN